MPCITRLVCLKPLGALEILRNRSFFVRCKFPPEARQGAEKFGDAFGFAVQRLFSNLSLRAYGSGGAEKQNLRFRKQHREVRSDRSPALSVPLSCIRRAGAVCATEGSWDF